MKHFALCLGFAAGLLGCYGQFEYTYGLEGCINYVVLAALLIGLMAAVLPLFAEVSWQMQMRFKSLMLWFGFVFCAATLFYGAAERVGTAQAGPAAERNAARAAVMLAQTALTEAKAKVDKAEADARAARKAKASKKAIDLLEAEASAARSRVNEATASITSKQTKAKAETTWQQPVWLLPLTIDYGSFIVCWFAGALFARQRKIETVEAPLVNTRSLAAKKGWRTRHKRMTIRQTGPKLAAVA